MKKYAGIGSTTTPGPILLNMELFAEKLSSKYILRTGGAKGADSAFIEGVKKGNSSNMEVYLPVDGFNGFNVRNHTYATDYIPQEAYEMAEKFHPVYNKLSEFVKKLMARNCMQVFGKSMDDPVDFIICYTHDGKSSGGTGQALRIAEHYDIKIYNLYYGEHFKAVKEFVNDSRKIS